MSARVRHLPSRAGNPKVSLCQEEVMLTGGYDGRAKVLVLSVAEVGTETPSGQRHANFADVVEAHGTDKAVRLVIGCAWQSSTDNDMWWAAKRNTSGHPLPREDCKECLAVRCW